MVVVADRSASDYSQAEEERPRASGKWREPGVPHKGWECIDVEDLGRPSLICEMCESATIRFVHLMEHPDYPVALKCGCICAGHMEGDYTARAARERESQMKRVARIREKELIKRTVRRSMWLYQSWRESEKGNPYLNYGGYNVVVYPVGQAWGFRVVNREDSDDKVIAKIMLPSENAAKLRALDAIEWLEQQARIRYAREVH